MKSNFGAKVDAEMARRGFVPIHAPQDNNIQDNWLGAFKKDGRTVALHFTAPEILRCDWDRLIASRCEIAGRDR